jgi:hypothetical protein
VLETPKTARHVSVDEDDPAEGPMLVAASRPDTAREQHGVIDITVISRVDLRRTTHPRGRGRNLAHVDTIG